MIIKREGKKNEKRKKKICICTFFINTVCRGRQRKKYTVRAAYKGKDERLFVLRLTVMFLDALFWMKMLNDVSLFCSVREL